MKVPIFCPGTPNEDTRHQTVSDSTASLQRVLASFPLVLYLTNRQMKVLCVCVCAEDCILYVLKIASYICWRLHPILNSYKPPHTYWMNNWKRHTQTNNPHSHSKQTSSGDTGPHSVGEREQQSKMATWTHLIGYAFPTASGIAHFIWIGGGQN